MNAMRFLLPLLFALTSLLAGNPVRAEETEAPKSKATAVYLSTIATVVPMAMGIAQAARSDGESGGALILAAYTLGPSVGHFYAGNPGAAMGGIGLRLVPIVGLGAAMSMSWDSPSKEADAVAVGSMALGAAIAVWDIARTSKSVRAYNDEHAHPRVSLGVIPANSKITPGVRIDIPM